MFNVNIHHARVLWDTHARPTGLLGGHLNIQSLKMDRIKHLVVDSNLDLLRPSETWLHINSPPAALYVRGYNMFRRDGSTGKEGGVMFYIKEQLNCSHIKWSTDVQLECIVLSVPIISNAFYSNLSLQTAVVQM